MPSCRCISASAACFAGFSLHVFWHFGSGFGSYHIFLFLEVWRLPTVCDKKLLKKRA
jgi:hypothetical protein